MEVPMDLVVPNHDPSPAIQMFKEISYGSVAGMISKVFEHPFDLTKVRLQSQVLDASARFNGPWDCLTKTWKNEGIRGLYRGLPAPVVGAMAENASLFFSYEQFKTLIRSAAAGAGAATSFILTPIELVKCKMQVQMLTLDPAARNGAKMPGPLSVFMSVVRTTGVRGLWLGHTGTFIRETGGTAAWFGTKSRDACQDEMDTVTASGSAVSGACAGAAFNIALFPADTVKSAMQTEEELRGKQPAGAPRPSFLGTFKAMYRAQGVKGLYAGCGITVMRSIPSSAIIFLTYDELKKMFG
ncbi:mitochondrial carrier [Ephemerocybe angulata]|uniref:Mitochondrial carrier n=1 Tax=Ephemerocybe angulata TaxID=980116 RepID=A0A8H6HUY3_9AGAR|nr:mitochondrial carrier [Tulosesus angulatus]